MSTYARSSGESPDTAFGPDCLVTQYLPFVDALARRIHRSLPGFVDLDDLVAFGRIGLVEASRRFDPRRGVSFKTYAYYRIRGAVFDGIRQLSGGVRRPPGEVVFASAADDLLAERNAPLGDARPLDSLADDVDRARDTVELLVAARLLSLQADQDLDPPDSASGPLEITSVHELAALMRRCVGRLENRERSVIEDHYFHGLSLKDAGARLGLSKSWTSRIHARALKKLLAMCGELGIQP
jgi:RNA polymerase sigma factor for flagellar operon FliA